MRKLFFLILCFYATIIHASLSNNEISIRDFVLNQKHQQILMLEKIVNINSGTNNINGVRQVGELLRPEFEALGFKTKWVEQPASMHRAGSLIAERSGPKGKRLLLIAHLDTVFQINNPFQRFTLQKNTARGPGVIDDKGGIVVILYALKALQKVNALDGANIVVVLTGDEEDSGKPTTISRKPLREVAKRSDIALDFEGSITTNTATIARRGISHWLVSVQGNEAHSAGIFTKEVGAGAIFELARIVNELRIKLANERYLTFNPGIMLGGTKTKYDQKNSSGNAFGKQNVVAKTAMVKGDLRFISANQRKSVEERMRVIVKKHLSGTKATITFHDGIPSMTPTKNNQLLLKKYSQASEDLGTGKIEPLDAGARGAGDISHIAALVPANLAGLGPGGLDTHSVNETVNLDTITNQTKRAAILIYRLIR